MSGFGRSAVLSLAPKGFLRVPLMQAGKEGGEPPQPALTPEPARGPVAAGVNEVIEEGEGVIEEREDVIE